LVNTFIELYRRLKYHRYGWFGSYQSWQEAEKDSTGYDHHRILEKIENAALQVKQGKALFEQDGVLYHKPQYSWPLLSHLLWIAQQRDNRLLVTDFGGSLGSSYFQHLPYLDTLNEFGWSVVEQAAFVTSGKEKIADERLQFFYSIDETIAMRGPQDVLLMSCVLPYLEQPYQFLDSIRSKKYPYIIIENTYFNPGAGDRLTIQKVPPFYYDAVYPAWFLDYEKVKKSLSPQYDVVAEYVNDQFLYFYGKKVNYQGVVMKLNS
jgi:putative methyltransferase (TIGR04325 family)